MKMQLQLTLNIIEFSIKYPINHNGLSHWVRLSCSFPLDPFSCPQPKAIDLVLFSVIKGVNIGEFWCSPGDTGGWAAAELSGEVSPRNKGGSAQLIALKHKGSAQTVGLVLNCGSEEATVRVSYHWRNAD